MALMSCPECGTEISDQAAACPKCGLPRAGSAPPAAPQKKKTSAVTWIATIVFGLILWSAFRQSGDLSQERAAAAGAREAAPIVTEPAETTARRKALLEKLQRGGVFGKIECRSSGASAWVKSGFYEISYDDKNSFLGVVAAHCFGPSETSRPVRVLDDRTAKAVGSYSPGTGLSMK